MPAAINTRTGQDVEGNIGKLGTPFVTVTLVGGRASCLSGLQSECAGFRERGSASDVLGASFGGKFDLFLALAKARAVGIIMLVDTTGA